AMKGRNDIEANGKKISGNAQFSSVKRMFSHGTLLFDTDLSEVTKALQVKMTKIKSKGHKSARARVANITEFLDNPMTTEAFRSRLLTGLMEKKTDFETYHLSDEDWKGIHQLREEKYG